MKGSMICLVVAATLAIATSASAQVVFSEDWDDGAGSTRWSGPIVAQEDPGIAFDGNVDYAFDYSILGAASAPNSTGGTTLGVAFETNTTDQCPADLACTDSDEGEGVAIVPLAGLADIPAGDFTLTADVYIFWESGNGSTEYATIGVHSGGTASPIRFSIDDGDGLAWQFDGDGGSGADLFRFEDGVGETSLGGYEDIPPGSIPGVTTCQGGVNCNTGTPIGPLNTWVEMKVSSVGGLVSLSMNGYVIDTYDNTGGTFSNGTILIGGSDPFNSVSEDDPTSGLSAMQVFDNIVLTAVPEPTSLILLSLAAVGCLGVRRR